MAPPARIWRQSALALMVAMLGLAAGGGCGSRERTHGAVSKSVRTTPPLGYIDSDEDADADDRGAPRNYLKPSSHDTLVALSEGREASPVDRRAVALLVKRWYALAATGAGAGACPLLSRAVLAGLVGVDGSPGASGSQSACALALARIFATQHGLLSAQDPATMTVIDVHVKGLVATALVGFRRIPVGNFHLVREHDVWRIDSLFDTGMS